jgi:hypothetical protein
LEKNYIPWQKLVRGGGADLWAVANSVREAEVERLAHHPTKGGAHLEGGDENTWKQRVMRLSF